MSRLLMLIAIAAGVYWLLRSYRNDVSQHDNPIVEDMVRCAHCGMHFPKSESIVAGGKYFCGVKHRDAYLK